MGFMNRDRQLERHKEEAAKYPGKQEFQHVYDTFFNGTIRCRNIGQSKQSTVYKVWISEGYKREILGEH